MIKDQTSGMTICRSEGVGHASRGPSNHHARGLSLDHLVTSVDCYSSFLLVKSILSLCLIWLVCWGKVVEGSAVSSKPPSLIANFPSDYHDVRWLPEHGRVGHSPPVHWLRQIQGLVDRALLRRIRTSRDHYP